MNEFLVRLAHKGPYDFPRGAGMSLRPEFYSGRGVWAMDVTVEKLAILYEGIRGGELVGCFPKGAAEAFAQMVAHSPSLTGTAFVTNLLTLDERAYVWDDTFPISGESIDIPHEEEKGREIIAFASLFGDSDPVQDEIQSVSLKENFFRRVKRDDLLKVMYRPKPVVNDYGEFVLCGGYPSADDREKAVKKKRRPRTPEVLS